MSQSRFWLLTEFNNELVQGYREWFSRLFNGEAGITYICGQKERCPETNRDHIQGYVIFDKRRTLPMAKRLLESDGVHLERRRGNHEQAVQYCSKEESRIDEFCEFGEFDDRGSQAKALEQVQKRIREGDSLLSIADEHFGVWCRYYKAFQLYRTMVVPTRDFKTEVRVYYGPTGVGKSRRATYECGPDVFRKHRGEWWDGYDGRSNVIIDDFYGWLKFDELLRCFDRYGHMVPIKGGFINFAPKLIIVTSNDEPRKWYNNERISDYRFEALTRRFEICEEMTEEWTEPIED